MTHRSNDHDGLPGLPRRSRYFKASPLRQYRHSRHMTQKKLAAAVHICARDIGLMERGDLLPTKRWAKTIADYFGVKVEVLFNEGFRDPKVHDWSVKPGEEYVPPETTIALRYYPREFTAMCRKCGKVLSFRTDDRHAPSDDDPVCPSCAMPIRDVVPLSEAANV